MPQQVHRVVEHDDATMADQPLGGSKRLVVERDVQQVVREVGPQRSAHLHGADRAPAGGAAAPIVDNGAQGGAERDLNQATTAHVAGKLDRQGAERAAGAVVRIGLPALGQDERHRGQRQHVVHHGRLAEQPLDGRKRGLCPHHAAAAFE